jgi:restriction system protein
MKIWLVRAGSHGEYESKFLQEKRVYVTWDNLNLDLAALPARGDLIAAMTEHYPNQKPKAILIGRARFGRSPMSWKRVIGWWCR